MTIQAFSNVSFDIDEKCPHCSYVAIWDLSKGNIVKCHMCGEEFYVEVRIVSESRELTNEERQERNSTCSDQTRADSSSKE